MKTLTQRALEIAVAKQEEAWQRACKATNAGSKKYFTDKNNRLAQSVIKLNYRLKGE